MSDFYKMYVCSVGELFMWSAKPLGNYLVDKIANSTTHLSKAPEILNEFGKFVEPYLRKNNYLTGRADDLIKFYKENCEAFISFAHNELNSNGRYMLSQGFSYYLTNVANLINIMFNYAVDAFLQEENVEVEHFMPFVKEYIYKFFSDKVFDYLNIKRDEIHTLEFTIDGYTL